MSQPALGVAASALVVALSLAYVSLFDFPTFAGPVAFFMLALIPAQIVLVVLAPDAPFAAGLRQPARGLVLLAVTAAAAAVLAPLALWLTGEGVFPPGPIPSHYAVIVVPTTFFLAIAFGGWPFTGLSRNRLAAAALVLVAAYALTYAIFRVFFDYGFLEGAPVYLPSAPRGLYHASWALVFDVTALAGMFLLLHFDLWPLTKVPALRRQPMLGIVWLIVSLVVAALVMRVTLPASLNLDPMWVLTRVTAPFIFGTIIVLNMLQDSLMAGLSQPLKGVANTVVAAAIGLLLATLYGIVAPWIAGPLPRGWPGYEYEIWLVNALLSVTFPFLVFHAAYFAFWPLAAIGGSEGPRTLKHQESPMAHIATDLAVTLPEDRPGMLARALGAVGDAGINIEGYAEMEGVVHLLTTEVDAARHALGAAGFQVVREQPIVVVPVEDRPGAAAQVFRRIADAKINLRFSYLATGNRLVISAENLDAVIAALAGQPT